MLKLIKYSNSNFHFGPLLTFTFNFVFLFCQSMVASIMVRANIFDVRIFCEAVGRTGPCFYVGLDSNCGKFFVLSNLERTKKLPEHALHCSCFNICAPAYYNHLLQRAWFEKSFNVKSDLTILFKQVFCFNSTC